MVHQAKYLVHREVKEILRGVDPKRTLADKSLVFRDCFYDS